VIGALALLQRRSVTGRGGVVGASLLETALVWNGQKADGFVNQGKLPDRHRSGHPGFVPYEAFDTADAPLLICCGNDRLFAKFAAELGRADWVADTRFATNRARLANKAALLAEMNPLLRAQPRATWITRFEAAGVPCAPIHTVPEILAHPQTQALGMRYEMPGENFSLTALPFTIDGERPQPQGNAPRLGQHNAEYDAPPLPVSTSQGTA